jgi:hypothetical protein
VFEKTMKNITFMTGKKRVPRYHLHMLLAFCKYTQMQLAKAASKDRFKPTFIVTILHAMWHFHKYHVAK